MMLYHLSSLLFLICQAQCLYSSTDAWQYPIRSPSYAFASSRVKKERCRPKVFPLRSSAPTNTDIDESLFATLQRLGVRGIVSPSDGQEEGVVVQTTNKSVAGRGAFFVSPDATNTIQRGDVLARIPKTSLLTLSNPHSLSTSDDNEASKIRQDLLSLSHKSSWPVSFTLFTGMVASKKIFSEWIESFMGPEPPCLPTEDDVQNLMKMANVSKVTAEEASNFKYAAFTRDWNMAKEWMEGTDNNDIMTESQFAKLYSILVSRTANLGPYYNNTRGVIPLHDMINHPPPDVEHSIELFTVGDLKELVPGDMIQQLMNRFVHKDNDESVLHLDDRDVLLVARREIRPGEELFLSYRNNRAKPMEEKERAWTALQYGFLVQ